MEKIKGTVSGVNNSGDRYGIIIGDTWYNGIGSSPANKGDEVEIEFEVNGNFNNIKNITVDKPAIPPINIASTSVSMSNADKSKSVNTDVMKACELFIVIKKDEKFVNKTNNIVMDEAIELVEQARKKLS